MNIVGNLKMSKKRTDTKSNVNCCVYGCKSVAKKNPELSFHRFPKPGQKIVQENDVGGQTEMDRRKAWEIGLKMGKKISPHMHVCSRHFLDADFITPNKDYFARRVLHNTAVPTQNLPTLNIATRKFNELQNIKRKQRLDKRAQAKKEMQHELIAAQLPFRLEDTSNINQDIHQSLDIEMTQETLENSAHIMVDKGFLIDNICNEFGIGIVRPPFLRQKKQFSKEESKLNASIASARVHIERVNARIKVFKIFKNVFPLHLVRLINEIFIIICGLTNLSTPILNDNLFMKN